MYYLRSWKLELESTGVVSTCSLSLVVMWRGGWSELRLKRVLFLCLLWLAPLLIAPLLLILMFQVLLPNSHREQTELKSHIQIACRSQWERLQGLLEAAKSCVYFIGNNLLLWLGSRCLLLVGASVSQSVSQLVIESVSQSVSNTIILPRFKVQL